MTKQINNEIREIDSDDGPMGKLILFEVVRFQCQNQSVFFCLEFHDSA